MSETHDSDEILLPDDAEQKLNELLEAIRISEEQMMAAASPESDAEPAVAVAESAPAETVSADDDFLSDEEGDFVDLDAELLDNSSDMLQLDESDSMEELLQDQLVARSVVEERPVTATPKTKPVKAEARDATRFPKWETPLRGNDKVASLQPLPPPAARASDSLPFWITPLLAMVAVMLSGSALWLTLQSPTLSAVPSVTAGDAMALEALKVDFAALRERLTAVEKRAEAGEEAVAMLEGMQGVLLRMEQTLLERAPSEPVVDRAAAEAPAPVAQTLPVPPPAKVPAGQAALAAVAADAEETTAAPVTTIAATTPGGKVFIKGWAVNLRSYYYKLDAERLLRRYQQEGITAEIREIPKGANTWYRVRVMGFASKSEANAFIDKLTPEQGKELAWPSHYEGFVEG